MIKVAQEIMFMDILNREMYIAKPLKNSETMKVPNIMSINHKTFL